jgi:fatty acid-binding protein DegV
MIAIITDSTGDNSEKLIEQFSIIMNSQMVIWGEQQR